MALHGHETGRIVRLPTASRSRCTSRWTRTSADRLVGFESPAPLPAVPNEHGVVDPRGKRPKLSRWFFEDRVAPATPAELEAAHGHHAAPEPIESIEAAGVAGRR